MLPAFVITLREGLEASLIVGIIAAYLIKTGRPRELKKLWLGVIAAIALTLLAATLLHLGNLVLPHRQQELMEGLTGMAAVVVLTWMIFWMRRHAHRLKESLHAQIDAAIESGSTLALAFLAFTAVVREGLETVLFLRAALGSDESGWRSGMPAIAGLVVAILLGYGLYRGGRLLDLRIFFRTTGALLILVAAGILASSIHELSEAGFLNFFEERTWDTSALINPSAGGVSGVVGALLKGMFGYEPRPTILQVVVYWSYLLPVLFAFFLPAIHLRRAPITNASEAPSEEGQSDRLSRELPLAIEKSEATN